MAVDVALRRRWCGDRAGQDAAHANRQAAIQGRRWLQGRFGDDERVSRVAGGRVRPLPRGESGRSRRTVADRKPQDDEQGRIREDGARRQGRQGHGQLGEQQDRDGQHRQPLRVPQGPLERRHHARARGRAEAMRRGRIRSALTLVAILAVAATASAVAADDARTAFRPCIDPGNLPFSNDKGEGFENRIATLFAAKLGLPVQSYSFPQRMNFIRNTLRYRLPGEDFRCDIVMSVPAQYDQALPTVPYYRSTYALVYRKGKGLDEVKSGNDLLALPAERRDKLRIGFFDRSPGGTWLVKHGMEAQAKPYPMM